MTLKGYKDEALFKDSGQGSKDLLWKRTDSVGGGLRSLTSLISQFRNKAGEPIKHFSKD